ncbi:hypothetical protein [Nocardioides pelophilus]|uniref:hypothetical protein n=1 Tax=Nocardioides pelophilus TaxID=2172019 RepID=UPI0016031FCA|nr:hypothetical protein [Nocardioides pelophilus]
MVRSRFTGLVLVLVVGLNGCGGDSSDDSSSKSDASDGESVGSIEPSESNPEVKAAESVASILETNSTGSFGFTAGQASCVAEGFVEQFGVEGLQDLGMLTEDLEPGSPTGGLHFSPVDASAAADATLACVNGVDFVRNLMNSGDAAGGFDEATVDCVADALGEGGVHDLLVAAFRGDQQALQDALAPAAFSCAM